LWLAARKIAYLPPPPPPLPLKKAFVQLDYPGRLDYRSNPADHLIFVV